MLMGSSTDFTSFGIEMELVKQKLIMCMEKVFNQQLNTKKMNLHSKHSFFLKVIRRITFRKKMIHIPFLKQTINKTKMSIIGYKIGMNGTTRVLITLEIPEDAKTNMNRPFIVVKESANYRANKVKVLAIEDDSGTLYATATSLNYKKCITYKVGETIEEPSYNPDPEKVCAEGIHYFLTRHVAELFNLEKVENGLYQSWYEDGQKHVEATCVDGKLNGLYQSWYEDGQKLMETTYVDGKKHGAYQSWHYNGKKKEEGTFVDGKLNGLYKTWNYGGQKDRESTFVDGKNHGLYQRWYDNGQKWVEATYVDWKLHGLYQIWHHDGQKNMEATYVDGKKHGLYQRWNDNGQKWMEETYVDGKRHGLYQHWHENGQKCMETTYVHGRPHGLYKSWNRDGTLVKEANYVHGEIV
jgi:antitoxin component YwqK of YwqJK toxin-antitoxin module